jgi:hypothetical protein
MARPPSDLDDYLDWRERLESYKQSGLSVDLFCRQEGSSKTTFYRWPECLKVGIPKPMVIDHAGINRSPCPTQITEVPSGKPEILAATISERHCNRTRPNIS